MKKILSIAIVLAMLTTLVFAVGPAPEVTAGLSADATVRLFKENTVDEKVKSGDLGTEDEAVSRPLGLKAETFKAESWVNFDWQKMSLKAAGKWDAFKADKDDFSWVKVDAVWKDFFGFEIAYKHERNNKELGAPTTGNLDKLTNDITATYKQEGLKFYTVYDANYLLRMVSVTAGDDVLSFFKDFKTIGFELDNDEIALNLKYGGELDSDYVSKIDTAEFTAKKMFGVWSATLNNADKANYRLNLKSDSAIDPVGFDIKKDNVFQKTTATNAKNTLEFGENLTVKAAFVIPTGEVQFNDWLAGENILLGVEYAIDGIGTIGAGAKVSQDYKVSNGTYVAPSKIIADPTKVAKGNAFWVDALLNGFSDTVSVLVRADAQFGAYNKVDETSKIDPKGKVIDAAIGNTTVMHLYGEGKVAVNDSLSFSAGALVGFGFGYDSKAVDGTGWEAPTAAQKEVNYYANYTEANVLNKDVYGLTPFHLKAKVDYALNSDLSFWLKDEFVLNAGSFGAAKDDDNNIVARPAIADAKNVYGFFNKNVISFGAKIKATENSTLSLKADVNMYLGLPKASDLYGKDADADDKKVIDREYATWKSETFNPFSISVSYACAL